MGKGMARLGDLGASVAGEQALIQTQILTKLLQEQKKTNELLQQLVDQRRPT